MKTRNIFTEFFESEKTGGFILISCTILSLLIANSGWSQAYISFWHASIGGSSIEHWVNDGLMAIFFLLIGLELEREIYQGELTNLRNASFPIFGALGGMLVPAGIYLLFNMNTSAQRGFGIPMATDIAFAIGILSLAGNRVPAGLKIFLTALAVIDDLGAILVIAFFYSDGIVLLNLGISLGIFVALFILNRFRVHMLWPYLLGGIAMWYFMLHSGVHATITGVMLAFVIPFGDGGERSPSHQLQHFLHRPVSFLILPIFALANTAILIQPDWMNGLYTGSSIGIMLGLLIGKPIGIVLFCAMAILSGMSTMPAGLKWRHLVGAGLLAGIGFTMSIFITLLAFSDQQQIVDSKIAILASSLLAACAGLFVLKATYRRNEKS